MLALSRRKRPGRCERGHCSWEQHRVRVGEFAAGRATTRALLAHELTHVVQQRATARATPSQPERFRWSPTAWKASLQKSGHWSGVPPGLAKLSKTEAGLLSTEREVLRQRLQNAIRERASVSAQASG